jgi:hypothetical protein
MSTPQNTLLRVEDVHLSNHDYNTDTYSVADRQGARLVSQYNPALYSHAISGSLFHGMSVTAGHVIPADNASAPTYAVWNPASSGVNLIPVCFRFGTITLGTRVVSALGFNIVTGTGASIATGSPVTAFAETATAIKAADFSTGTASKAKFSNTGTVTVSTSLIFFPLGVSHDLITVGEAYNGIVNFDGSWIVPPGTLIFPASHGAATGSTYLMQLTWLEVPIVS